jgi:NAD(P)-dependent dehydrogenase (short-subunit alcohol dehydrogenase family)
MSLEGKVAVVTGAGRGLGSSIALGFAEAGASVVLAARTVEQLEETAALVKKAGGETLIVPTNVTDEDQVNNMVGKAMEKFGRIDCLVNNAGITAQDKFIDMPFRRWRLIMSVNLDGSFLCAKAVLPGMIERGGGTVINVSSILAKEIRMNVAYGVTKLGLERFTLGLAREMRKNPGVAIACIRPYFVKTEVVMGYMAGRDLTGWEDPEMWQKYTPMIAGADPQQVTGKILDKAALEEMFGPV